MILSLATSLWLEVMINPRSKINGNSRRLGLADLLLNRVS